MTPRVLGLIVASSMLVACDGCRPEPQARERRVAPSTATARAARAPASSRSAADAPNGTRMGAALVSGASDRAPSDPAPGFRHSSSFLARMTFANPGQRLTFELVDRVAVESDSDDAHRVLRLETTAGKETLEATLSFFSGEPTDPARAAPRRVRLVAGSDSVEVEVPAAHLPSRRCKTSANAMKSPLLYLDRWASLLLYAQAGDDRGLVARMLEPPVLELEGKTHMYPEWPEPGWLWRVRVEAP